MTTVKCEQFWFWNSVLFRTTQDFQCICSYVHHVDFLQRIFMCIPFIVLLTLMVIVDTPVMLARLHDNLKAWTHKKPDSYAATQQWQLSSVNSSDSGILYFSELLKTSNVFAHMYLMLIFFREKLPCYDSESDGVIPWFVITCHDISCETTCSVMKCHKVSS